MTHQAGGTYLLQNVGGYRCCRWCRPVGEHDRSEGQLSFCQSRPSPEAGQRPKPVADIDSQRLGCHDPHTMAVHMSRVPTSSLDHPRTDLPGPQKIVGTLIKHEQHRGLEVERPERGEHSTTPSTGTHRSRLHLNPPTLTIDQVVRLHRIRCKLTPIHLHHQVLSKVPQRRVPGTNHTTQTQLFKNRRVPPQQLRRPNPTKIIHHTIIQPDMPSGIGPRTRHELAVDAPSPLWSN